MDEIFPKLRKTSKCLEGRVDLGRSLSLASVVPGQNLKHHKTRTYKAVVCSIHQPYYTFLALTGRGIVAVDGKRGTKDIDESYCCQ